MVLFQCVSGWIRRTYLVKNLYTSGNPWLLSPSMFVMNPCNPSAIMFIFRILSLSAKKGSRFNLVISNWKHSLNHTSQNTSYLSISSWCHCSCSPLCLRISSVSKAQSPYSEYHPLHSPLAVRVCASTSMTSYPFCQAGSSAIHPWGFCTEYWWWK